MGHGRGIQRASPACAPAAASIHQATAIVRRSGCRIDTSRRSPPRSHMPAAPTPRRVGAGHGGRTKSGQRSTAELRPRVGEAQPSNWVAPSPPDARGEGGRAMPSAAQTARKVRRSCVNTRNKKQETLFGRFFVLRFSSMRDLFAARKAGAVITNTCRGRQAVAYTELQCSRGHSLNVLLCSTTRRRVVSAR